MPHPFTVRVVHEPPLPVFPHLFWYCTNCCEVFRATPFDSIPQYTLHQGTVVEEPCNEREGFLRRHHGHQLGLLKRIRGKLLSDRPLWDPMRTVYEEVTNSQQSFLLKSWREDISAPRRYLLLSGSLVVEGVSISVEEELLRSVLRQSCSFAATTLDRLMGVIQKTVGALSPDELTPAHSSETDPNLCFAYLSDQHLSLLVCRCGQVVSESEIGRLRCFFLLRQHSEELTISVHHQLRPYFT